MAGKIMTRSKMNVRDVENKLKVALLDLQASRELSAKLIQEQEEYEVEMHKQISKNTVLKNQLAELDIQYQDVYAQRDDLKKMVDSYIQCHNTHELSLDRITSLEQQLSDALKQIQQLNELNYKNETHSTLALYDELMNIAPQNSIPCIDLTSLNNTNIGTERNNTTKSSKKIKKYIKLNKLNKKIKNLIKTKKNNSNIISATKERQILQNQIADYENVIQEHEFMTTHLQSEICRLKSSLHDTLYKYSNCNTQMNEYIAAMNEVIALTEYNEKLFNILTNQGSEGFNTSSALMERSEQIVSPEIDAQPSLLIPCKELPDIVQPPDVSTLSDGFKIGAAMMEGSKQIPLPLHSAQPPSLIISNLPPAPDVSTMSDATTMPVMSPLSTSQCGLTSAGSTDTAASTYIFSDAIGVGLGGVWSLRNVSISVPRGVLSGEGAAVTLRCQYDLEGAALYSIRWYRADTEFYRYVPREMPPTMVFPLPGASVDLSASDRECVRVVGLHRRLSGVFACEVSADAPLFHTDIRAAPLTIVDPPFRAPRVWVNRVSYVRGGVLRANCSVDAAYPAANLTWTVDGHKIAEHISPPPSSELDYSERAASSSLELTVLEAEHYRVGLTYTSGVIDRGYQDHYVYEIKDTLKKDPEPELLRYALAAPPSGQFALHCVATIYDVYARTSERVSLREDAPHPASVTGEDSAGAAQSASLAVTSLGSVCLLLLNLLL